MYYDINNIDTIASNKIDLNRLNELVTKAIGKTSQFKLWKTGSVADCTGTTYKYKEQELDIYQAYETTEGVYIISGEARNLPSSTYHTFYFRIDRSGITLLGTHFEKLKPLSTITVENFCKENPQYTIDMFNNQR